MITIGEFSKICGVTTRTLRHYDELNLIKPKKINNENGYRFYEVYQLRDMLLINKLKKYEFSLEDIGDILYRNDTQYTLRRIKSKEEEIKSKIEEYEKIQKEIKKDILNLERGKNIMEFINDIEVKLIETKDQIILSSRQLTSVDDYGKYIGKLFERAYSLGVKITGKIISIYHDKEFDEKSNDTEFALPVLEQSESTRILKGGICATTTYKGAYSNLGSAYTKLMEWIEENDYEVIEAPYEQYIKGIMDTKDPDECITEIYFPVRKL